MDNVTDKSLVTLLTRDNVEVPIYVEDVQCSGTIMNILVDMTDVDQIPVEVDSDILDIVIDYCQYHSKNIDYNINNDPYEYGYDSELIDNIDIDTIFDLINAANYLEIDNLLDLTTKGLATYIEGKTTEKLREMLKVENDYTPAEEAALREKYKFIINQN